MCIDLPTTTKTPGSGAFNANHIQVWSCFRPAQVQQVWEMPNSTGLNTIRAAENTKFCMDLRNAEATPGNWIQLWECYGQGSSGSQLSQQWMFDYAKGQIRFYRQDAADQELCVSVLPYPSLGTHLTIAECSNTSMWSTWQPQQAASGQVQFVLSPRP
jgi:hypothetical protein